MAFWIHSQELRVFKLCESSLCSTISDPFKHLDLCPTWCSFHPFRWFRHSKVVLPKWSLQSVPGTLRPRSLKSTLIRPSASIVKSRIGVLSPDHPALSPMKIGWDVVFFFFLTIVPGNHFNSNHGGMTIPPSFHVTQSWIFKGPHQFLPLLSMRFQWFYYIFSIINDVSMFLI